MNKNQLELFGAETRLPPLPAADPRLVELAGHIPAHVRMGTSSWTFKGWTGLVYRRGYKSEAEFVRDSLFEYARFPLFGSVGIDRTFYGPVTADELEAYAKLLPKGFQCVSKVWRDLATYVFPRFAGLGERSGRYNPDFLNAHMFNEHIAKPYQVFQAHAGPFVVEVPPFSGAIEAPRFERAVETFLQHAQGTFAFELREPALLTERYFAILRAYGASHCFNQWAWMPPIHEQLKLSGGTEGMGKRIVARLMLPGAADYEDLKEAYAPFDRIVDPQPAMRAQVLRLADVVRDAGQSLDIIVNNKAEGCAALTIVALAELFAARRGE